MKVIAIANHKGGVGKTTTTLNLGAALAELGHQVLMIDLDPQSSLTLATVGDCAGHSVADVLGGVHPGRLRLADIIRPVSSGLDLAPSDLELSNTEFELVTRLVGRENVLRRATEQLAGYDVVLVDCPPSLSMLVVNALAASQGVIVPTTPTGMDLRAVQLFLKSIDDLRPELNPDLEFLGVLVCQFSGRLRLHQAALDELKAGSLPVLGVINHSVQAATTAGQGEPLTRGPLAEQYRQLAEGVHQWLNATDRS